MSKSKEQSINDLIGPSHKLLGAADELERNADILCRAARVQAKVRRASYDALRKQGFTETQALFLCQNPINS